MDPDLQRAITLHQSGQLDAAEPLYRAVLARAPGEINATQLLGVLYQQQGRAAEAAALLALAAAAAPGSAAIQNNYGNALKDLGRLDEAAGRYRAALALDPGFIDAKYNLGRVRHQSGDSAEAVDCFDAVLAVEPPSPDLLNDLGLALQGLRRFEAAAAAFRQAAALAPDQAVLQYNLGNALGQQGDTAGAEAGLRRALDLAPDLAAAMIALSTILMGQGRHDDAIDLLIRAEAAAPDSVLAPYNRGCLLQALKRHDEAASSFDRVLVLDPDHGPAFDARLKARLLGCDWARYDEDLAATRRLIARGTGAISPFVTLVLPLDPAEQVKAAQDFCAATWPAIEPARIRRRAAGGDRLHIAYLSGDFHCHATSHLMAALFETHDRSGFDITGISFGPDDGSAERARIARGFDHFLDLRLASDAAIAERIAELGVDLAIDLKGHTKDNRFGIFAHRPAPLQVSYLGYPGPTGAAYIDYVIADKSVLPASEQQFWGERIVHLTGCYQVNDSNRHLDAETPSRAECGLPEPGFVFCCFNNGYKITPPVFESWMRLLAQVPGSVLWLYRDNHAAERRLKAEAGRGGIDPARLIFAGQMPLAAHLARHRQADLFLDTSPYNAHTTASDALRAGLPLVTWPGQSFAGRVAASLLSALGLPELIAADQAGYERLALDLALDPARLQALRQVLIRKAAIAALFDVEPVRIGLEAAYRHMMTRYRQGLAPSGFAVSDRAPPRSL